MTRKFSLRASGALAALVLTVGLSACAPVPVELAPLPEASVVSLIAANAYANLYGRAPDHLVVTKVGAAPLVGSRPDHYVCFQTNERRDSPIYNMEGKLLHAIGSPYKGSHIALIRDYSDIGSASRLATQGWGAGVVRMVTKDTKVGFVHTTDLCPLDEMY